MQAEAYTEPASSFEPVAQLESSITVNQCENEPTQLAPPVLNLNAERGLREIDRNIETTESTSEESREVKELDTGNKVVPQQKGADQSVTQLLEKLLAERNRLLELGIIKKEGSDKSNRQSKTTNENRPNQENLDPSVLQNQPTYNPNAKTVKLRQGLATASCRQSNIGSIENTINKYNHYLFNTTAKISPKSTESQPEQEQESQEVTENEIDDEKTVEIDHQATVKASIQTANDTVEESDEAKLANYKIVDLLHINRDTIDYGSAMPGQVLEESLEVSNKSEENLVVQIVVDCLNPELIDSDEYVYAIRRSHSSDYNDKHYIIMSPYSSAHFKLAIKLPGLKLKESIRAEATFSIQGVEDKTKILLECKSVIPKVLCPKELYSQQLGAKVINLAMKNHKKMDTKIPLRNNSDHNLTLDLDFFKSKEESEETSPYDCYCFPSVVTLAPNSMSVVAIAVKPNSSDFKTSDVKRLTKILTAKCRDSSLTYSFVVDIAL